MPGAKIELTDEKWADVQKDMNDPYLSAFWGAIKKHAEARGGTTLQAWRLHLAFLWGGRSMMTTEEVGNELGLDLPELHGLMSLVNAGVHADMEVWRARNGGSSETRPG